MLCGVGIGQTHCKSYVYGSVPAAETIHITGNGRISQPLSDADITTLSRQTNSIDLEEPTQARLGGRSIPMTYITYLYNSVTLWSYL